MKPTETTKTLLIDPGQVSDRFEELTATLLESASNSGMLSAVTVAEAIGYFRAHIERDATYYEVLRGGVDDEE